MATTPIDVEALNRADPEVFLRVLGPVFENAPWVARAALDGRPYPDLDALHAAMTRAVRALADDERVAFLSGHPDLAGKAARARDITEASIGEQASAGLDRMSEAQYARFDRLNGAYRERFGFPFIVCVRNYDRAGILDAYELRLANARAEEIECALDEISEIARHRLSALTIDDLAAAGGHDG